MTGFGNLTLKLLSLEDKVEIFTLYDFAEAQARIDERAIKRKQAFFCPKYSVAGAMGKTPRKSLDSIAYSL